MCLRRPSWKSAWPSIFAPKARPFPSRLLGSSKGTNRSMASFHDGHRHSDTSIKHSLYNIPRWVPFAFNATHTTALDAHAFLTFPECVAMAAARRMDDEGVFVHATTPSHGCFHSFHHTRISPSVRGRDETVESSRFDGMGSDAPSGLFRISFLWHWTWIVQSNEVSNDLHHEDLRRQNCQRWTTAPNSRSTRCAQGPIETHGARCEAQLSLW